MTSKPVLSKLTAFVFLSVALNPAAQDSGQIVDRFQDAYRSSRTLQANFLQRYFDNGREIRSEAGIAYFGRPGKMRWEYQSPERNLYVIDGKWSWFYVPADHTVTRVRARESSDWRTPLALLAGEMKVSRICAKVTVDLSELPSARSNIVLRCELRGSGMAKQDASRHGTPRAQAAEETVLFEVNPGSGELSRIVVSDPGGIRVEFQFSAWRFDPHLDARIFRFDPPTGVAIVDGELAGPGPGPTGRL